METKRLTIPAAEELLDRYFPVLDHGFIALKDYMGGDEAIDEAARTSYGAGTRKVSDRRGLLRSLRRKGHTSPSEMCELKFHMAMPIFVARQLVRHRTASLNEYSGRYSLVPMMFYMPDEEQIRKQSKKNKQGRDAAVDAVAAASARDRLAYHRTQVVKDYEWMVEEDFARELARIDLPLSAYTQWYWKIDLHNLLHCLEKRCPNDAQYETRMFANVMAGMVKRVAPLSFEAWVDYTFAGERMSRMEMDILRMLINVGENDMVKSAFGIFSGGGISAEGMLQVGLSKTEIAEFTEKFKKKDVPSFDLDLSLAQDGEFFSKQWEAAVPKIDQAI